MRFSSKQKGAIEKISGRYWNTFSLNALTAYFAFTDKGRVLQCDDADYYELMECHHQHSMIVEMWKDDFRKGLLFLWDFLKPEYPQSYIQHAFDIYESTMGYIPSCYRQHPLSSEV